MCLNCVLFLVHVQIFQYLVNSSQILLITCVYEKENAVFGYLQLKDKAMFWHAGKGRNWLLNCY